MKPNNNASAAGVVSSPSNANGFNILIIIAVAAVLCLALSSLLCLRYRSLLLLKKGKSKRARKSSSDSERKSSNANPNTTTMTRDKSKRYSDPSTPTILAQSTRNVSGAVDGAVEQSASDAGSEGNSDAEHEQEEGEDDVSDADAPVPEQTLDTEAPPIPGDHTSAGKKAKVAAKKKGKAVPAAKKAKPTTANSPKPTLMQQYSAMFSLFDIHPSTEEETKMDAVAPFNNPMHSSSAIKNRIKKLEDISKGQAVPSVVAPASDPKNKYRFFGVFRLTTRNSLHNRPAVSPKPLPSKDTTPVTPSTPVPPKPADTHVPPINGSSTRTVLPLNNTSATTSNAITALATAPAT